MRRYAIYFAPEPEDPLWPFGSAIIGYDAANCRSIEPLNHPLLKTATFHGWTKDPRQYGFHATLKAPFSLATDKTEEDLVAAINAFCATQASFIVPPLAVTHLEQFIALTPPEPAPKLNALADTCVQIFDPFRAPLSEASRAKRLRKPLSALQKHYLETWGYPHVFEDFRFHMTLTGSIPDAAAPELMQALHALYQPIASPLQVQGLTLFRQDDAKTSFRILRRFSFTKSSAYA
jgi:putative phosphonate metabolism protein